MKGFTIIETLVTIVIFSLIAGAVSGLVVMLYRTHGYTFQQSLAIGEARRGIETMVEEIREARPGADGSYPIVKAEDKEFIFYSDIDKDSEVERVRYFLGTTNSSSQTKECQTSLVGGTCSVSFSDFLQGTLALAEVKISVQGDFGWAGQEYASVYADGSYLGRICQSECSDCASTWQGLRTFTVTDYSSDDSVTFLADATSRVDPACPHAMKARFELSWTEELSSGDHLFKKGVIEPVGNPPTYPTDQEEVWTLTSYVRNVPPIFRYFDAAGEEITELPARLVDTKLMEVYLIVNINPNRAPQDFELKSSVQLRNLHD